MTHHTQKKTSHTKKHHIQHHTHNNTPHTYATKNSHNITHNTKKCEFQIIRKKIVFKKISTKNFSGEKNGTWQFSSSMQSFRPFPSLDLFLRKCTVNKKFQQMISPGGGLHFLEGTTLAIYFRRDIFTEMLFVKNKDSL